MKSFAQGSPRALVCVFIVALFAFAQWAVAQAAPPPTTAQIPSAAARAASSPVAAPDAKADGRPQPSSSSLVIGSGDELQVTVYGAPDLSGVTRVGTDGNISLPLVGHVQIAGLTSDQAQAAISAQLREQNIVKDPQVSVFVKEYSAGEISVAGEVVKPGVFSALGPHRLLDILEQAGGLTEKASNTITISHRGTNKLSTIHLSDDAAETARNNIELLPGDTVVVPKAGIVYVLGDVNRPGGYALNSSGGVTLLQVLAAAGGATPLASLSATKMVRRTPSGLKEFPVPMKALLHAKSADIPMKPGDIVYVPSSRVKSVLNAGTLLSSASSAAVYRIP